MKNAICNCHTSKREPHWCEIHGAMRETPTRDSASTETPAATFVDRSYYGVVVRPSTPGAPYEW